MPSSVKLLQDLLAYCTEKNRVIAKNIANIGTENYQREDVEFKEILNESSNSLLKTTNQKHIGSMQTAGTGESKFEYVDDQSTDMQSGVNNVSIEKEMSDLAENTLRYKFASRKIGDYYRTLQEVIKTGGNA